MSLFSYFKKTDKVGKDSAIASNELVAGENSTSTNQVITKLSE